MVVHERSGGRSGKVGSSCLIDDRLWMGTTHINITLCKKQEISTMKRKSIIAARHYVRAGKTR